MKEISGFGESYSRLNEEQKRAVDEIYGSVMVVAGPGTGKTEILSLRIVNILRKDASVRPGEILALTFTENGAVAMRERLFKFLGTDSFKIDVSTFHSFCNQIILDNPELFSFKQDLQPINEIEKSKMLRELIDSLPGESKLRSFGNPYYYLSAIAKKIEMLKKEGITALDLRKFAEKSLADLEALPDDEKINAKTGKIKGKYRDREKEIRKELELAELCERYQEELGKTGRYDFEDMISFVVTAFKRDADFKEKYRENYRFILVDEYQDTNNAQNEVVNFLVEEEVNPNLFVVGDDDQSIFRFQGASMENVLFFNERYPQLKVIPLKENYRNTQTIIDAAQSLINNNQRRITNYVAIEKAFRANSEAQEIKVILSQPGSRDAEYFYILKKIEELKELGYEYKDIAVMYRKNSDALPLVELFKKERVPFSLSREVNALDNLYVQKLISLLKVLVDDPNSNHHLFRYLFSDFLPVDPHDAVKISSYASRKRLNLFDLIQNESLLSNLNLNSPGVLIDVGKTIVQLKKDFFEIPFADFVVRVLNRSGILEHIVGLEDNLYDLNQLNSFVKWTRDQNVIDESYSMKDFLNDLDFMKENGIAIACREVYPLREGVKLMSAHKAKGLEFPVVFIIECISKNWEEQQHRDILKLSAGLMLREEATDEKGHIIEEERRLFYVACTRAKERLYITFPAKNDEGKELMPSLFIRELDNECIENEDTDPYEQMMTERLLLGLSEVGEEWKHEVSREALREIVSNLILNATSLNNYLKCPAFFKYENLYRIPGETNRSMAYGSAVHATLERVFYEAAKTGTVPVFAAWEAHFRNAVSSIILPAKDKNSILEQGLRHLKGYCDFYRESFHTRCLLEYSFYRSGIRLNEIPLSGKIDKIDLMENGSAHVIDYKTGKHKTRGAIEGSTKNSDGNFFRQLVFYKLLIELDENFSYEVTKAVIDFIEPREDGNYIKEEFEIATEEVDRLKETIRKVYEKIQNLEFEPTEDNTICRQYNGMCRYYEICKKGEW